MRFICEKCGISENVNTKKHKCECGGLWKLKWKVPKFDLDLIDKKTWSIFRYRKFMPLIDEAWKEISLGEGMTPIIKFNENILLKMDYFMPTLSFKDRGAAILISHCKSIGVKSVIQDSSGNAGNSVAAYCGRAGIDCEIFVPKETDIKKINIIKSHNAKVNIVNGNRDECARFCRSKLLEGSLYYASHVYNPFFYEGTKTYIYEVYEQLGRVPSNIFIPIGNGTLFIGIIKALEDLLISNIIDSFPNIILVQSELCNPIKKTVSKNKSNLVKVKTRSTLAKGIAIGEPMRSKEILEYIYKYDIKVINTPENRIIEARKLLSKKGIYCENTTAATYAAYLEHCDFEGKLKDTLIPMCGAGHKSNY